MLRPFLVFGIDELTRKWTIPSCDFTNLVKHELIEVWLELAKNVYLSLGSPTRLGECPVSLEQIKTSIRMHKISLY